MSDVVFGNGQPPKVGELRRSAARLGLPADGGRIELFNRLAEHQRKIQAKRKECAIRGLPTDGELEDLELRLAASEQTSTTASHRRGYQVSIIAGIILGIAALAISVPHMAQEIGVLMGMNTFYGVLCALVIDGGFVILKVMDSLRSKFHFTKPQRGVIWGVMGACLVMAASLNASNFIRHAPEREALAIGLAVFLSVFVFSMFYMGTSMAVRCEPAKGKDKSNPVVRLRETAKELDRLLGLAEGC